MASAWGVSWGVSWGSSWGLTGAATGTDIFPPLVAIYEISPDVVNVVWWPNVATPTTSRIGFRVYLNGVPNATMQTGLSQTFSGLVADTAYKFEVCEVTAGGDGTLSAAVTYQYGSKSFPTVTYMTRKIPFPTVGWN